jgi:hypothetical protein
MTISNTKYGLTDAEVIEAIDEFHSVGVMKNASNVQEYLDASNEAKTAVTNELFELLKFSSEKGVSPEMVKRSLQELYGFPYRMYNAAENKMVVMNPDGEKMPKTFGNVFSRVSKVYLANDNSLAGFTTFQDIRDFLKPVEDNLAKLLKIWDKLSPEQKREAHATIGNDPDVVQIQEAA